MHSINFMTWLQTDLRDSRGEIDDTQEIGEQFGSLKP